MAENNPMDAPNEASPAEETSQMAVVRAAREAFFARANGNGRATPEVSTPEARRVDGGLGDATVAGQSAEQRIASRNGGEGLLAVGVLSDLGGERAYRVWATGDSEDLKLITDLQAREKAFEAIVDNMRDPQYREALSLVDFGLEREALRAYNARPAGDIAGPQADSEMAQPTVASISSTPIEGDGTHKKSVDVETNVSTTLEKYPLSVPKETPVTPTEIVAPAVAAIDATVASEPTTLPDADSTATTPKATSPDVLTAANPTDAAEENTIEADLAPQRDRSLDESSDEEMSEEEKRLVDKVAGRGPAGRLLDAFARSLIGREQPGKENEISSPAVMTKDGYAVPEAVASRYVVRDGDFWRFDEKDPGNTDNHKPKFTDKGPRLSTVGNDRGTVSDMVTIAQAKGWQQITLKGSETFRRNAWIEANLAGMKTQGFKPKDQDRAMLEQARRERDVLTITAGKRSPEATRTVSASTPKQSEQSNQTPAAVSAVDAPGAAIPSEGAPPVVTSAEAASQAVQSAHLPQTPQAAQGAPFAAQASTAVPTEPIAVPVEGGQPTSTIRVAPEQPRQNVLLAHGAAPYKNDKDNAPSYFVSYSDPEGATQTVWGKDLERAVRESGVKPGDPLTLENLGSRPVTVNRPVRDAEGKVVRIDQIDTHLNVWDIQKQEKQSPGVQEPTATAANVAGLRDQIEKALAGQPDNVVREVMDRLAERLQAGIAVQTEQQKANAPAQDLKPAIDTRLAQVDVDRQARQTVAEIAPPKRSLDQGVAKQSAPSMTR